jgi:copper ion binding protein
MLQEASMKQLIFGAGVTVAFALFAVPFSPAEEVKTSTPIPLSKSVKATFLITGLHCPPCTTTVENSLKSLKGVKSAKVDWATKNAKVEYDEVQVAAQQIAGRIASTSHMMGGKLQYSGWLALKVPEMTSEGNVEKARAVLTKVKGVSNIAVYPQQKSVGVEFSAKGNISSAQLLDALKEVGLEASVIP